MSRDALTHSACTALKRRCSNGWREYVVTVSNVEQPIGLHALRARIDLVDHALNGVRDDA